MLHHQIVSAIFTSSELFSRKTRSDRQGSSRSCCLRLREADVRKEELAWMEEHDLQRDNSFQGHLNRNDDHQHDVSTQQQGNQTIEQDQVH